MFRKVSTNVTVHKWKPEKSPLCTLCKNEQETTLHLLVKCHYVQRLWKNLTKWLKYFCAIQIEFTPDLIILNNYSGYAKEAVNTIILITKFYIYCVRCDGNKTIQFQNLVSKIAYYKQIEQFIATRNNKCKKHDLKWQAYKI